MTGMEPLLIGAALVGTGTQIYGQIKSAQSQADAYSRDAAIKGQQADELMAREQINEQIMARNADKAKLTYAGTDAATGFQGGGIGGVLQINKELQMNLANSSRDAAFKAQMLRAGANIEQGLASDAMTGGYIGAAGTLLGTAGKAVQMFAGPGGATSLGAAPRS